MTKEDIIKRLTLDLGNKQQYIKDAIDAVKKGDYERNKYTLITNLEDKVIPLVFYDFFTIKDK